MAQAPVSSLTAGGTPASGTLCRLIYHPAASGPWNMAVDEALLLSAVEERAATLRFYGWSEPTLSLGYFQQYADRQRHLSSATCAVVRRLSGGGAIVHDRELTYSLALPAGHSLARATEQLYLTVHRTIAEFLNRWLSQEGEQPATRHRVDLKEEGTSRSPAEQPFLCFLRHEKDDGLLRPSSNEHAQAREGTSKIFGSAQRRRRGAVLLHGSLLLQRSPAAPELAGLSEITGQTFLSEKLSQRLAYELADALDLELDESSLPEHWKTEAQRLEPRYLDPGWTHRR